jgi:hypothetical protein
VTIAKNIDGSWRPGTTQPTYKASEAVLSDTLLLINTRPRKE